MGISNYTPNSRLAQPGVCTSTTRPASPYEGQVIYETDTNQTLVYSGSAWVMVHDIDTPPALELVMTQTVGTGVATVTVSNAFSATWDNYIVTLTGGVSSTLQAIALQLDGSTTGYYANLYGAAYNSTTTSGNNMTNATSWTYAGIGDTSTNFIRAEIMAPYLSKLTGISSGYLSPSTTGYTGTMTGFHNSATSFTGFKLIVGGTMTGGTIRVYGYRNS